MRAVLKRFQQSNMMHARFRIVFSFLVLVTMLGCNNKSSVFEVVPASSTGVDFQNNLPDRKLFNILYYLYYYNGGGVAAGDINNDGKTDLFFTSSTKGGNRLYLNKGNFEFDDITATAGVQGRADWCTGATMADINGDGLLDIYVSQVSNIYGLKGVNELYINDGNNHFTESAAKYGLDLSCFTTQTSFFDYDHDGDLDCFILNQSHHPHANIVDTSFRQRYDSLSGDRLYRNDIASTGKFTDVSKEAGIHQSSLGYGLGIAIADLNNDGWDDIYIGNDFHENDYCYINDGHGHFLDQGSERFKHFSRFSMGNDINDFNNDGQPDVITVDMLPPDEKTVKTYGSDENPDAYRVKIELHGYGYQYSRNCLQRNDGNGETFSDVGLMAGVSATDWSWSPLFADFDNDGYKDLFISSGIVKRPVDLDYVKYVSALKAKGMDETDKYDAEAIDAMPDGSSHPFFFRNTGSESFTDVSNDWGTGNMKGYYNGAAYADLDNDGDLDMIVNCLSSPALLMRNNTAKKHFISFKLQGDHANTGGIGAKLYVFTGRGLQYQQAAVSRGFQSSSDGRLHFGLDSLTKADSVLVVWPDQRYQLLRSVPADSLILVEQKNSRDSFDYQTFFHPEKPAFVAADLALSPAWKHKENDFNDFNIQYLIPHRESTRGPGLAVADLNGDGLDDFFIGGAAGEAGAVFYQDKNQNFTERSGSEFESFRERECTAAIFFDANADGKPDLYIANGGNERKDGDPALGDLLFINTGNGFRYDSSALPAINVNSATVSVADVDHDGDQDIFVGTLANAQQYGIPPTSFLLLNDGNGKFMPAPKQQIDLEKAGMITSSAFADMDADGWADLVVSGEWMGLTIYYNRNGQFEKTVIPNSTGLWQNIQLADVNQDGKPDILAGNWGHNTKLWAGKNGPCKLYVKDFDKNGSIDQVLCYTIDGKQYTFLAKDELERALPVLRKAYLTYGEVAGKDVQYMFYDLFTDYEELTAERLGNSCFFNRGNRSFQAVELPDALQRAPIFSFTEIGNGNFIAAGNFYGTIPYEGRYDAQQPISFTVSGEKITATGELDAVRGQVRNAAWLSSVSDHLLLLARNNASPLFYKRAK